MPDCRSKTNNDYSTEFNFDNGFGLSVVSHQYSYGGTKGLFEVALLNNGDVVYNKDFPDVKGHLSFADVAELINKVRDYSSDMPFKNQVFLD